MNRHAYNGLKFLIGNIIVVAGALSCLTAHASSLSGERASKGPINFAKTSTLHESREVRSALSKRGLRPCSFESEDKENIRGLYYHQPKAQGTIIVCPGLLIKKEMYSSFIELYGSTHNILFYDARGQGQSRGWNVYLRARSYGKKEYLDVVSAMSYAHFTCPSKPIFLFGFCSGAYHAARALIYLKNNGLFDNLNVKGFVFDSGWYSVRRASKTAPYAAMKDWLFSKFKSRNSRARHTAAYLFYTILYPLFGATKGTLLDSAYWWNDKRLNIFETLRTIDLPIFFIHSVDDDRIPVNDIEELSETIPVHLRNTWWIQEGRSKHAWHFARLPEEYHYNTTEFMRRCVGG